MASGHKKGATYFYNNFGKCRLFVLTLSFLDSDQEARVNPNTSPKVCCHITLWNLNVHLYNFLFILARIVSKNSVHNVLFMLIN